jgi:hypothetical protein
VSPKELILELQIKFKLQYEAQEGPMDVGSQIAEFFKSAAGHWTSYVAALSIIGGVTMAFLQTIKDLFPVRQLFQRYALQKWMHEGEVEARSNLDDATISPNKAEADLLILAVDGDPRALYDLQIEQLCGQFTAAIQIVLEFPETHLDLLAVTASKSAPSDIRIILKPPPNPPPSQFLDARTRITHQCQRAIDAFQIATGFRWKWVLQLASIVISAALAWIALRSGTSGIKPNLVSITISSILAGFLAPVAKDLLAVLQKARGQ